MKLEHIAFNVEDPVQMARWYAENLELKIVREDEGSPFIRFLADRGGSMIEIYNNPAVQSPDYGAIDPLVLHLAFEVEDIEKTRDRLISRGATLAKELAVSPLGDKMLFLRDPWQVPLQLIKRKRPLL